MLRQPKRRSLLLAVATIAIALLLELAAGEIAVGMEPFYGPVTIDVSMLQNIVISCTSQIPVPISSFTFALLNVGTAAARITSVDITAPTDLGGPEPASRGFRVTETTDARVTSWLPSLVGSTSVNPPALVVRTVAGASPIPLFDGDSLAGMFSALVRLTERAPAGATLLMAPEISVADVRYAVFSKVTELGNAPADAVSPSLLRPMQIDVSYLQSVVICVTIGAITGPALSTRDGFTFALLNAEPSSVAISWIDFRLGDTLTIPVDRSFVVDSGRRTMSPPLLMAGLAVSPPAKLVHVVASAPRMGAYSTPEWIMVRFTDPAPEGASLLVVPEKKSYGDYYGGEL